MKICLTIILLLTFNPDSIAQYKEFEFKNLTTENGLPSNESYFIYRDSRNYLWFATDQGVARYNGSKMEKFDLPDNVVFKIYEDWKGRIWFFSHTGKLAYFYKEKIYPYKYNDAIARAFKTILITNAYITDEDEIIINDATKNIKISATGDISTSNFLSAKKDSCVFNIIPIKGKANTFFTQLINVDIHTPSGIADINLNTGDGKKKLFKISILQGGQQQYNCISENGKHFFFYFGRNLIRLNKDGTYRQMTFEATVSCVEADKNEIWVGLLKNGAILMDTGLNIIRTEKILADRSVTSIRKDYEGGMWFSTLEKGVFYLKNSNIKRITGDSTLHQNISRVFKTSDSSLLFGIKDGIFRLSGSHVFPFLHTKFSVIADIFEDSHKNIFVAGDMLKQKCLFGWYEQFADPYFKKLFVLFSNTQTASMGDDKYFTNTYYGTKYFDISSQLNSSKKNDCLDYYAVDNNEPGNIFVDTKKKMWRGTLNNLYYYNSITAAPVPFKPYDSLFNKGVTCMRQMINETYAIGVRFGGIAMMQDTTVIARITEKDGLLSNSVKYLLPLKDQLWAATASGISIITFQSYAPVKYSITNIGRNEGLYDIIINQLLPFGSSIIAATSNGIYEIEQAGQFLNNKPRPIFFYINSVNYYNADTTDIGFITLPYNNNRVVIKYSAVCFNLADELKYYYRFDNADTNWNEITATELLLENLIPGNYTLHIKATVTGEQRFSEIKTLKITVEKPWWQNNWLKLLVVILVLGIVYVIFKLRVNIISKREKQNAGLKTRMIELEQTTLRSQMNPHFIFNCLTSIQQLIISGDKTAANEYLVKFARLIRKTLDLSARSFISVEEETDYLREYLVLEQLRIPGQFNFLIGVDKNINVHKTEIPGMMLQPIIENSIRHGIKHLENKNGLISISLKQQGAYILCTVIDNGVGRAKSAAGKGSSFRENKSYGMEIVTRRLSAISFHHENEGTISVEDLFNEDGTAAGTKVTMLVPFKTK